MSCFELTKEEGQHLYKILDMRSSALRTEIVHTHDKEFKQMLKDEEAFVTGLMKKLETHK